MLRPECGRRPIQNFDLKEDAKSPQPVSLRGLDCHGQLLRG
jgi:hypothetical protein